MKFFSQVAERSAAKLQEELKTKDDLNSSHAGGDNLIAAASGQGNQVCDHPIYTIELA